MLVMGDTQDVFAPASAPLLVPLAANKPAVLVGRGGEVKGFRF
jgi:hypothetical protein